MEGVKFLYRLQHQNFREAYFQNMFAEFHLSTRNCSTLNCSGHINLIVITCRDTVPDINTHFTINHKNKLLRYELAGVSIHLSNHFYSLIRLDNQFYKFDSIRESTLEIYPNSSFIGTINTVYYTLHSSE